jgi:PAS domain S-box-containing protein
MPNSRILIVEDEAIVAADLKAKLKALGYEVVGVASRGEQAVALAEAARPHLILMDILLAGDMDGIEAAGLIQQSCSLPVIFLTAHSDSETLTRAKRTAPFGYLLKPFNERELETHIEMALYRHQIEGALRENEGRLRLAIDATHLALWDWDIVQDRATWAGHYGDLFGLPEEQFKGTYQELLDLAHEDDREPVRETMERALNDHAPYACEFRVRHQDGSVHWLTWWGEVYRDDHKRPIRMVGLLQDITRRRMAEDALRAMTSELEQRVEERTQELVTSEGRLRALSRELNLAEQRERRKLATDLHDYLAQLLVLGRIKLGQAKRGEMSPSSAGLVGETEVVLGEALTYTRSLVGQLSPPVLKEFGLVVALKWLAEQMRQHRLTVAVEAESDHLPLAEDQAVLLFQSVRELLMNVVKHADTEAVTVRVDQSEGVLRVVVEDRGRGFDAAAARMTAQFGLFSIKERMQALGGRFLLDSEVGKGTTASLILSLPAAASAEGRPDQPAVDGSSVSQSSSSSDGYLPSTPASADGHGTMPQGTLPQGTGAPGTEPATDKVRVLLVDDHAMIRQGLRAMLLGYSDIQIVGEAANGIEAVEQARSHRPDVVIMDVTMPRMDGIEATQMIKTEWPTVLVIGLTVHTAVHVQSSMKNAGAWDVITKEAAVDELHRTIQAALGAQRRESRLTTTG